MGSIDETKLKPAQRKEWSPMQVRSLGTATDLIKTGGGKTSLSGGDPGEGKKQKGGMS